MLLLHTVFQLLLWTIIIHIIIIHCINILTRVNIVKLVNWYDNIYALFLVLILTQKSHNSHIFSHSFKTSVSHNLLVLSREWGNDP